MADFVINIPDPWVPRAMAWVDVFCEGLDQHPIVVDRVLPLFGVDSLMDLTPAQRARFAIKFSIYSGVRSVERRVAGEAAENAAKDDVDDNFPIDPS